LDGYRIERELHASARTQVYLATDEETGTSVVIKTPSVNYSDDPTYLDMFVHEEWIGRRIDNNHVLKIIEQTRTRHFLYYVTEYIEGQTLRQWINDNPTPNLNDVRGIIEQIARGLRAFHRKEMIHQDLKPENIIIDTQGTVKIIDFGSTKVAGVEEISTPIHRLSLLGTQLYTAPEYLLGQPATYLSDAFSLGIISYEMLTGNVPFTEKYGEKPLSKLNYKSALDEYPHLKDWWHQSPIFKHWDTYYGISSVENSGKSFHSVKLEVDESISGIVRAIKGPFLIIETPDELVSICAKDLKGREIDFSEQPAGLKLNTALQAALF
jgi:serine/threonine protein kinase